MIPRIIIIVQFFLFISFDFCFFPIYSLAIASVLRQCRLGNGPVIPKNPSLEEIGIRNFQKNIYFGNYVVVSTLALSELFRLFETNLHLRLCVICDRTFVVYVLICFILLLFS